jgi:hypothetical protein
VVVARVLAGARRDLGVGELARRLLDQLLFARQVEIHRRD